MEYPVFIDFEASSLNDDSYPIEVAWNDPDGTITSILIKPHWSWTDWDPNAEELHGIARAEIEQRGVPPEDVCRRISEVVTGRMHSDAPAYDGHWLKRLFDVTGGAAPLLVGLSTIPAMKLACQQRGWFEEAREAARKEVGTIHRAGADVEVLMKIFQKAGSAT